MTANKLEIGNTNRNENHLENNAAIENAEIIELNDEEENEPNVQHDDDVVEMEVNIVRKWEIIKETEIHGKSYSFQKLALPWKQSFQGRAGARNRISKL